MILTFDSKSESKGCSIRVRMYFAGVYNLLEHGAKLHSTGSTKGADQMTSLGRYLGHISSHNCCGVHHQLLPTMT